MMLLLCSFWSILLLCLCISAEDTALRREPSENVALECSSAGCPSSIDGYVGMYLYHHFKEQEEVLYYHSNHGYEKISPRQRYKNRIQKKGSLKNHTITISNLTLNDSGLYSCVYKKDAGTEVKCDVYMLVVIDLSLDINFNSEEPLIIPSPDEKCPPLVLIIIATFAVSMVIAMIFKTVVSRVKHWISSRGTTRNAPPVSNDYVYEVMTMNGLRPFAPPQQLSPSPYNFV